MSRQGRYQHIHWFGSVIASVGLTLFIFSAAVVLILNARWLYYLDINLLDIPSSSGFTSEVIRANYDTLIDYCSLMHRSGLTFPTLTMSETGRIHFAECKQIFDAIQLICLGSLAIVLLTLWHRRGQRRGWIKTAGVMTLVIPVVLGVLAASNWNRFFVTFHHIFFHNNYWLFDPATDPVILILPDTYFLHCAIGILILIALGGIICLKAARRHRR